MAQDVVKPVLLHYPADRNKAVGTAMVVAPGGAFRTLMMSYEGVDVARKLNAMGIDAFVLKYRLLYTGPGALPDRRAAPPSGQAASRKMTVTGTYKAQEEQDLIAMAAADGQQAMKLALTQAPPEPPGSSWRRRYAPRLRNLAEILDNAHGGPTPHRGDDEGLEGEELYRAIRETFELPPED